MTIPKVACNPQHYQRRLYSFGSAREAFAAFLQAFAALSGGRVLLPAYIGWSSREGSGVFDPIKKLGLDYEFYALDRELHVNLADLAAKLTKARMLVVIHYFGRPDPQLAKIVSLARRQGVAVIEDAAHALFSSLVGGTCGCWGDATIYSLHKMLPLAAGGLLQINGDLSWSARAADRCEEYLRAFVQYDWCGIARRRLDNEALLRNLIARLPQALQPLWPDLPAAGVVPQTFPVLVGGGRRDRLYFGLNEAGFGAVSLYHQLIDEIRTEEYPVSHWLAANILNLPVHQDCDPDGLAAMVQCIGRLLSE